jgi:uncharacterized membrane protein
MDAGARELLDLLFRWVHVIAAIMWIGNSLLYNWLDRNLLPSRSGQPGSQGEIWLLHSGGFYRMEKNLAGWERARPLHWFKWQAYTTWLSGAALLVVVYYLGSGALLVDPASGVGHGAAVGIGVGLLLGGWLLYHYLIGPLLDRVGVMGAALGLGLVLALAWTLAQVFGGRAMYLHVGAVLGTLMAGNVFRVIMPSQRELVAAVEQGRDPDPAPSLRAKSRSIHNNYLTFPVIVLMLSSHFPGLYGHPLNWLLLGILVLAGALVRHLMNIRFTFRPWLPTLGATVAAALATLYLLAARPAPGPALAPADGAPVAFADVHRIVLQRCTVCHSAEPAERTFGPAPGGVAFDTPEQILAHAARIRARAVDTETMPPGNSTHMLPRERAVLRGWIAAGAGRE